MATAEVRRNAPSSADELAAELASATRSGPARNRGAR